MQTRTLRRVVVTGLGPVTAIGTGAQAFHDAQLAGRSGVREITRFDTTGYHSRIAAEVDVDFDPFIDAKERKRLDRYAQLALVAADLAVQDARLDPAGVDPERAGVLIGSGVGGMSTFEAQARIAFERGMTRVSPFFIPMMMTNAGTSHAAVRFNFQGPSSTSSTACSTGTDSIGNAVRLIQHGEADVMLTGGAEAMVTPLVLGAFGVMRALSARNDDPAGASRPFDTTRDGFVLGEGAAVLVLEDLEHARARGARILAEVVGFGRSVDAHHLTEPHPQGRGVAQAMQRALRDAGVNVANVGYVNAHATSTPLGDRAEALAIQTVFGEHARGLAVSSTKSMTGHAIGSAGAIEAVATVQALTSGVLPPTINLHNPDPELVLDFVPNAPREKQVEYAMSNSFAFGGLNASLLFRRWAGE